MIRRIREFGCCLLLVVLWVHFFADRLLLSEDVSAITFLGYGWIGMACLSWALLLLTPALLFGRKVRVLYAVLLPIWTVLIAIQWFLHFRHHLLLWGDWVGIVLCSSSGEALAYLRDALTPLASVGLIGALVLIGFLVFWCAFGNACTRPGWKVGAGASAVCLLAFVVWNVLSGIGLKACWREPMVVGFVTDSIRSARDFALLREMVVSPRLQKGFKLSLPSASAPICVFVLGESATRNRWGLYGYPRDTTPCLSALRDSLCVFSNVTASASNTGAAMRRLFLLSDPAAPDRPSCSLAQALDAAGYDCTLLSSHERWGRYNGLEDFLFSVCRETRHLSEESLPEPWYDDALLPYLVSALARTGDRPPFVFLHLMGSHTSMCNRYPVGEGRFPAAKLTCSAERNSPSLCREHYDNSIAFTDRVLGEVVALLEKTGRPAWMFYISDHGESVDSASWRDQRDPSLWEVPAVWWHSAAYGEMAPETVRALRALTGAPLHSDSIFEMVLQMAFVKGAEGK